MCRGHFFLLENYSDLSHVNIGTGEEISIKNLIELIKLIVGFNGNVGFDLSKPDGTYEKLLNSDKIKALGWHPNISLHEGLKEPTSGIWITSDKPNCQVKYGMI